MQDCQNLRLVAAPNRCDLYSIQRLDIVYFLVSMKHPDRVGSVLNISGSQLEEDYVRSDGSYHTFFEVETL